MGKRYKAVVIDGKSIFRKCVALTIVVVMLGLAVLTVFLSDKDILSSLIKSPEEFAIDTISEYMPAAQTAQGDENSDGFVIRILKYIMGMDTGDLTSVYKSEMPIVKAVNGGYLVAMANDSTVAVSASGTVPIQTAQPTVQAVPENMKPIKRIDSSQKTALGNSGSKILLKNETSYSINIDETLNAPLELDMKQNPLVLIVHTHATESFSNEGEAFYDPNVSDRSTDTNVNIVSVGAEMARVLKEKGIGVIHDTTLHDYPSYNGSYANSLATVEKYKQQYPSIQIVLDVHRDAIVYDDGTKAKVAQDINGRTAAQIMLVVGTNDGGLEHSRWRENLKFAMQLQNFVEKKHGGLMRGLNLRKERFNGHTSLASIIVEVGTNGNTLSEAKYSGELFAKALAEFVK